MGLRGALYRRTFRSKSTSQLERELSELKSKEEARQKREGIIREIKVLRGKSGWRKGASKIGKFSFQAGKITGKAFMAYGTHLAKHDKTIKKRMKKRQEQGLVF